MSPPKPRRGVACVLHHHQNRQAAPKLLSHPDFGCSKQLPKPAEAFLMSEGRVDHIHVTGGDWHPFKLIPPLTYIKSRTSTALSKSSVVKLQHWSSKKKATRATYFHTSFFLLLPQNDDTLSFLLRAGPVVDSFDLPRRCCPALEFLLGVSFPTKKREKFRMRTRLFICFFEKIVEDYEVPTFCTWSGKWKKCMNWSDICFSAPRNDHDFRIFVPSSGRKANFFGSHIFKQCKEQENF